MHVRSMPKEDRDDLEKLKASLKEAFPTEDDDDRKEEALEATHRLKQGGRTLAVYFEEARQLGRYIGRENFASLCKHIAKGLDNEFV
ncbi:hypothetical protein HYFRA_00003028 [Hymenoscyphus fraxineus]|uniref:Retrotransposon gag domain-containing protein n=1 Tax=Hymenoscyphus fraxineus TaxID=746836 RepID=A0A9N9PQT8_9HELO|nr:hypothetical protein HYFRA_00003028 [Hymenoscyphus fraxineus]